MNIQFPFVRIGKKPKIVFAIPSKITDFILNFQDWLINSYSFIVYFELRLSNISINNRNLVLDDLRAINLKLKNLALI